MRTYLLSSIASIFLIGSCASQHTGPEIAQTEHTDTNSTQTATKFVSSQQEFREAIERAQPGDEIVLRNGIWSDFDMLVVANGSAEAPILIRAETAGDVVLTGASSLRLGGSHLVVSGLLFRDGHTPRPEVISFRADEETLAYHSRVTDSAIINYSNPDRTQRDIWVALYGQNNSFDRNHLSGKLNAGPTMAVRLNSEESQNNNHVIAHNYFGPRPVFGSNGGETLRIGTSHFSLTHSGTIVENNFFDRCSGEVEIVSNKSGGNVYRGNTFYRSRGTLTLRHGNGTLVENNLFDGANDPYTGGVRVINAEHTIRNNYFTNLTGERFSGALVVMNGVPNSPINRYHQVRDTVIEQNIFDGVRRIELAEGADEERTAAPIDSQFRSNIIISSSNSTPFRLMDDLSGIEFLDNRSSELPPDEIADGFEMFPASDLETSLPARDHFGVEIGDTGVAWLHKIPEISPFDGGQEISVVPGRDTLSSALMTAQAGDTLILQPGSYSESRSINLHIPVSIIAAEGPERPEVTFQRPNLIRLSANGAVQMRGLNVSGAQAPDASGNSFISTTSTGGSGNHIVELHDMMFDEFDVNRGFSIITASKGTFFDRILIQDSRFSNVSGAVVKLDAETDDYGIYNAEYLIIENSDFSEIGGSVATVYRGGRDESTFGPHVWIRGSRFDGIGTRGEPVLQLHGAQNVDVSDNRVINAAPANLMITTGHPVIREENNQFEDGLSGPLLNITDLR